MATHEPHSHGQHHGSVHLDEADWEAFAEHAELEGELLLGFVTDAAHWIAELRGPDVAARWRGFSTSGAVPASAPASWPGCSPTPTWLPSTARPRCSTA